ncbi:MAG: membrane integrity-associated transporter subunit PqiC [SAR324 cluster bacterium]|nr:membrane integrity-associated transporter subunit PqiC [SAR324 cluster bacterium]
MKSAEKIKSLSMGSMLIFLLSLLVACTSEVPSPTQYFFLETPSALETGKSNSSKHPVSLLLKKVDSVSPFNTTNFAVKIRPSEVRFYNYAKWVSPPQDMLNHYFLKSLAFSKLAEIAASRSGKDAYHIEMEVQEFGQTLENNRPYGSIRMFIGIRYAQSKTHDWYTVYHEKELAKSDRPYDVVVALNRALTQLNQKFLKDLDSFIASQPSVR